MPIEDLLSAPQLGEFVWHQQTQDSTVDDMSQRHLATLRALAKEIQARGLKRPLRVLELGAYRHYSAHMLADEMGAEAWLSDISTSCSSPRRYTTRSGPNSCCAKWLASRARAV